MSDVKDLEITDQEFIDSSLPLKEDPLIGVIIDQKYRVDAFVGRGGMGVVYQGLQLMIERAIAIKFLHSHLVDSSEFLRRFKHEAKIASRLRHQNAIMLYDYGIHDKTPYLVMEYCPGKTLKNLLVESGPMCAKRLDHYVQQICAVLEEAHSLGIIHRDIKPENVIVPIGHEEKENLRVLDFGIAKLLNKGGDVNNTLATQTGVFFGTPGYAAPEQVCNRELDGRSDIYALGVMFYEALSGTLPFTAPSLMEILLKHVNAKPPPLRVAYPELNISASVEAVIMKCLEKNPADRFQNVGELAKAFKEAAYKPELTSKPGLSFSMPRASWLKIVGSLALMLIIWAALGSGSRGKGNKAELTARELPTPTLASTPYRADASAATQAPVITIASVPTTLPTSSGTQVESVTTPVPPPTLTAEPVEKFVGDLNALIMKAENFYSRQQYAQAIPLFEQALKHNPKLFRIRVDLGRCYAEIGKNTDALEQYQTAIRHNPKYATAHYEIACLKAILGHKTEALGALSRAVRLDGRFRDAAKTESDLSTLKSDPVFRQIVSPARPVRRVDRRDRPIEKKGESATDVVRRLGRELWSLTE